MKKITYLITFLMCCQFLNAQSKKVSSFNAIAISGSISAELVASDEERVEYKIIKGDVDNLVIENKGNSLVVKTKGKWYSGTQTSAKVVIYYKSISDLEVSSGSTVLTKDRIKSDIFDLEVSSGSTCSLAMDTGKVDIEVSSGSTVTLDGTGRVADIEVSSGSSFRASKFIVENGDVEVSSGSTAQISAIKSLTGDVSSGSTLRYYGEPSKVDVDKDVSSSVSKK